MTGSIGNDQSRKSRHVRSAGREFRVTVFTKGASFFLTFMNLNSMPGETEHTEHPGTAMGGSQGESGPEGGTEAGEWTIPNYTRQRLWILPFCGAS